MYHSQIYVFVLLALLISRTTTAQDADFAALKDSRKLESKLAEYSANLQTLSADFIQVKEMKMLQDKVKSEGRFYYKKQDRIRIEYTKPFNYLVILSGDRILIKDGDQVQQVHSDNSRVMQTVNRLLLDCMKGKPFDNPDFSVDAFQSASSYLLILNPVDASVKKLFSKIEILMDKASMQVTQLSLLERSGDRTRMRFVNIKKNISVPDALFNLN